MNNNIKWCQLFTQFTALLNISCFVVNRRFQTYRRYLNRNQTYPDELMTSVKFESNITLIVVLSFRILQCWTYRRYVVSYNVIRELSAKLRYLQNTDCKTRRYFVFEDDDILKNITPLYRVTRCGLGTLWNQKYRQYHPWYLNCITARDHKYKSTACKSIHTI